jgi:hypothetical protein
MAYAQIQANCLPDCLEPGNWWWAAVDSEPPTSAVTAPERCAYDLPQFDFDERCSRFYVVLVPRDIWGKLVSATSITCSVARMILC